MTNTAKALYTFWNGFGIPAYIENCVPDDAAMPYITYSLYEPTWNATASLTARVWYRSTSLTGISAKVDEIAHAVGGGAQLTLDDGGFLVLFKDSPFAQYIGDESSDGMTKCFYLLFVAHVVEGQE